MTAVIRVSEIFGPTIQGEGAQAGRPTVFVRLGGCDYRCSWCDTPHAVLPQYKQDWQPMTAVQVIDAVNRLTNDVPILITISGGNPALYDLAPLIAEAHSHGHTITMETQGSIARPWFRELDHLTISPKPPSSGMRFRLGALAECVQAGPSDTTLKIVVFDDADYAFARAVSNAFSKRRIFLSVGNSTPTGAADLDGLLDRTRWLIDKVNADHWYSATVLPQLHVILWGNARGV